MSHAEELTNWMWRRPGPLAPLLPMVRARAKRVTFLFLHGGPSQVDTVDLKPRLVADDGKSIDFNAARTRKVESPAVPDSSPWKFARQGPTGRPA